MNLVKEFQKQVGDYVVGGLMTNEGNYTDNPPFFFVTDSSEPRYKEQFYDTIYEGDEPMWGLVYPSPMSLDGILDEDIWQPVNTSVFSIDSEGLNDEIDKIERILNSGQTVMIETHAYRGAMTGYAFVIRGGQLICMYFNYGNPSKAEVTKYPQNLTLEFNGVTFDAPEIIFIAMPQIRAIKEIALDRFTKTFPQYSNV